MYFLSCEEIKTFIIIIIIIITNLVALADYPSTINRKHPQRFDNATQCVESDPQRVNNETQRIDEAQRVEIVYFQMLYSHIM